MEILLKRLTEAKDWDIAVIYSTGRGPLMLNSTNKPKLTSEYGTLMLVVSASDYPNPVNAGQTTMRMDMFIAKDSVVGIDFMTDNKIKKAPGIIT